MTEDRDRWNGPTKWQSVDWRGLGVAIGPFVLPSTMTSPQSRAHACVFAAGSRFSLLLEFDATAPSGRNQVDSSTRSRNADGEDEDLRRHRLIAGVHQRPV